MEVQGSDKTAACFSLSFFGWSLLPAGRCIVLHSGSRDSHSISRRGTKSGTNFLVVKLEGLTALIRNLVIGHNSETAAAPRVNPNIILQSSKRFCHENFSYVPNPSRKANPRFWCSVQVLKNYAVQVKKYNSARGFPRDLFYCRYTSVLESRQKCFLISRIRI
jgi:hypothetical protein